MHNCIFRQTMFQKDNFIINLLSVCEPLLQKRTDSNGNTASCITCGICPLWISITKHKIIYSKAIFPSALLMFYSTIVHGDLQNYMLSFLHFWKITTKLETKKCFPRGVLCSTICFRILGLLNNSEETLSPWQYMFLKICIFIKHLDMK